MNQIVQIERMKSLGFKRHAVTLFCVASLSSVLTTANAHLPDSVRGNDGSDWTLPGPDSAPAKLAPKLRESPVIVKSCITNPQLVAVKQAGDCLLEAEYAQEDNFCTVLVRNNSNGRITLYTNTELTGLLDLTKLSSAQKSSYKERESQINEDQICPDRRHYVPHLLGSVIEVRCENGKAHPVNKFDYTSYVRRGSCTMTNGKPNARPLPQTGS